MNKNFFFILLGLSKLQENIIRVCNKKKINTIICDKKPNFETKNQLHVNCSNVLAVKKKVLKYISSKEIKNSKFLAYCGSEFGLQTAHKLNLEFGSIFLNSYKNSKKFINKNYGSLFFKKNNIRSPKKFSFKKALAHLEKNGQVIIKPENLSGSKGVFLLSDKIDFKSKYYLSKKIYKKIICEEFVEGNGIDVQGYVCDKKLFKLGVGDRYFSSGMYKIPICGNYPSTLDKKTQNKAYDVLKKIISKTNFNNSFIKGDMILSGHRQAQKKIHLLEVSPRLHGDVFSSNSMFYNDTNNLPIDIFLDYYFKNRPMRNVNFKNKKITVWHSLFFKKEMKNKELNFFLKKIKKVCNPHKIFLKDKIIAKKIHQDNSTISGFFWFSITPNDYKETMVRIEKNLNKYIQVINYSI